MPKLKLGYTLHSETEEISGIAKDDLLSKSDTSFFVVELKLCGGYEIQEFNDLQSSLEHSRHHDLVYRFIEYTDIEGKRRTLVIHNLTYTDKVFAYQNFYGIGSDWKLYVNSKGDVVVQHIKFAKVDITARFRNFPIDKTFYLYLSCLIYTLTNCQLFTENDIKTTFLKVFECVTK
ncbi:MAG: hypothetical protein EOO43_25990 [Flavobacterium sp.]|nr:MAG: hypothetical protein EOO43_25990 [Flavobacterium sp.]